MFAAAIDSCLHGCDLVRLRVNDVMLSGENRREHKSEGRRWLPRKRDIRLMTDEDIKVISDQLNNTSRKCLGWKTPAEVFRENMLAQMGRSPYPGEQ